MPKAEETMIYQSEDWSLKIDVFVQNENIWLNQKKMSEIFDVDTDTVSYHLQNIYETAELDKNSTTEDFSVVQNEGNRQVSRKITHYNLDAIIAVGYRINSFKATQFRIWATKILKEYIIKGFSMDDERLKNWWKNPYFDELLERIRDIRTSERNFYQKIADIYATAIDYNAKAEETIMFFKVVQNKMHYAIHRHTASEIIYERADHKKPHMWLTNFPWKKVNSNDVVIAKNYLTEDELWNLNSIVSQYLDFAERQARRYQAMTMKDWIAKLDDFIKLDGWEILQNAGKISAKMAEEKAKLEYEQYNKERDKNYISDFDEQVKKLEKKEENLT